MAVLTIPPDQAILTSDIGAWSTRPPLKLCITGGPPALAGIDPGLLTMTGMPAVVTHPAPMVFQVGIEALDDGGGLTFQWGTVAEEQGTRTSEMMPKLFVTLH